MKRWRVSPPDTAGAQATQYYTIFFSDCLYIFCIFYGNISKKYKFFCLTPFDFEKILRFYYFQAASCPVAGCHFASNQVSPTWASTSSGTESCTAPSIPSTRIFSASSAHDRSASTNSSSCTCRISLASSPRSFSSRSTRIMAILIISAAVHWMGLFIATRSPKCWRFLLEENSSGI